MTSPDVPVALAHLEGYLPNRTRGRYASYGYELYLPNVMEDYARVVERAEPSTGSERERTLSRPFLDACVGALPSRDPSSWNRFNEKRLSLDADAAVYLLARIRE
jgi:hypothetical protein